MARLWKKSLLLATSMVLPTFALTACAGDSQYGTVASVSFNYFNSNNRNSDDFDDFNSKTYGFNNWTDSNVTYEKNGSNWVSNPSSGYVNSLSNTVISLGQFVEKLVTASLVGFTNATTDIPIFSNGITSNDQFLQFLYAASNSLNFGQNDQLSFGLKDITTKISAPINPQEGGNVQVVDKDSKELGYTNDSANITFTFTFGYWHAGDDNPTSNGNVSESDVKNYVETYNVWAPKEFSTYYSSFDIGLNLQARIQSIFTMSDDFANNTNAEDYQTSDKWSNGDFLKKNSDDDTPYPLTQNDLNYFKIKSDSNLLPSPSPYSYSSSPFKLQFESTNDSVASDLLKAVGVGTYDTSSLFTDNYSTIFDLNNDKSWYSILNNRLGNENLTRDNFTDYFTGVLSFVSAKK